MSHDRRQVRNNPKSSSHHYSTLEDSMSGFRMEPRAAAGQLSTMQNAGQFGSTWYRKDDQRGRGVQRTTSSVRVSNHAAHLTSQRSYATSRGTDLHPSSSAARNTNSKYNRLDVAEPANALDRPVPANKDTAMPMRDAPSAVPGYGGRNRRMNYSGPLVPLGGNMDEKLKEHERQIQVAVRKARVDKERTNRSGRK
ncbi:unnamed protein product [Triticum turgidum subsp. durum]|uniref:Uncharacterized protein n=1 Tax=Triticum turgidum subsp. durum TaxID=4567 RepID=A0A9R0YMY8_TRITD|nr:unnamed protein product [Triticum turgidum subsp. durum]